MGAIWGWIGTHYSDFSAKVANEWKMKVARGPNLSKIFDQPLNHHTTLQISAKIEFFLNISHKCFAFWHRWAVQHCCCHCRWYDAEEVLMNGNFWIKPPWICVAFDMLAFQHCWQWRESSYKWQLTSTAIQHHSSGQSFWSDKISYPNWQREKIVKFLKYFTMFEHFLGNVEACLNLVI